MVPAGAVVHGEKGGYVVIVKFAEHDKWFREQVQRGLDDPHPALPNEEVGADFAERRAALRKLIDDDLE